MDKFELTGSLSEDCESVNFKFGKALRRVLHHLRGKDLMITIRPARYKRSDAQNRYYWGVVVPTVRAWHKETTGDNITKDECHAYILSRVQEVQPKFKEILGQEVMYFDYKTTSKMTIKEFVEFVDKVQAYFSPLGCIINDPNQNNFLEDHL